MAALQQMMAQMGGGEMPPGMGAAGLGAGSSKSAVKDDPNAEHKRWIAIYPIYIDAKRPYGKGCRRVAYEKSCLFPMSLHIAHALKFLNIPCVHEVHKTHPKDWENPGRVKAKLFNEDWQSLHPKIKSKKQLIEAVSLQVQAISGGPPPPLPDLKAQAKKLRAKRETKAREAAAVTEKKEKGATAQGKKKADESAPRKALAIRPPAINPIQARLRQIRFPPREERLPPHSPAVESGMLNMDMPGAMAGVPGMENNPMASMLGSLMGGNEEEEEEEEKKEEKAQPGLSRRQKKRVVRVGR